MESCLSKGFMQQVPINKIYSTTTLTWRTIPDYPIVDGQDENGPYFSFAPIVEHKSNFYVFGGSTFRDEIYRFAGTAWSLVGHMVRGRQGHNVIYDGTAFIVVGGPGWDDTWATERCLFTDDADIDCETLGTETLYNYAFYPEMMVVNSAACEETNHLILD